MTYSKMDKVLMWVLGSVFAGVNALDLATTWIFLQYGAKETNILPALAFEHIGFGVSAVILSMVVAGAWVVMLHINRNDDKRKYAVLVGVFVVILLKIWVVWSNFTLITVFCPLGS